LRRQSSTHLHGATLAEPGVQISSFRFLTGELRSQRCSDGRSEVPVEGAALRDRYTDPMGIGSLAAPATSARSSEADRRTSLIDECCPICRSRHSGLAFSRPVGHAAPGSVDAGYSGTSPNRRQRAGVTLLCRYLPHHVLTLPRLSPNVAE